MTAVASSVFTAAQFNTFIRDNLNETSPAKATTAGAYFTVSGTNLRVGRASIERKFVWTVESFRGAEATAERGPRLNGLAFMWFRGWIDPVVKIQITDPADRTPYWLTSSRRPEELVAALTETGALTETREQRP